MSEIGPATVVKQSGDAVSREVNGQLIILTPSDGMVHELDEMGRFVWDLCAEPASVGAMTAKIVNEYEVEESTARQDLALFLAKLIDAGAVVEENSEAIIG